MIKGTHIVVLVGGIMACGILQAADKADKSEVELKQEASKEKPNRAGCLGATKPQLIPVQQVASQVQMQAQKAVMNDGATSDSPPKEGPRFASRAGCGSDAFYGYGKEATSPKYSGRQTPSDFPYWP